MMEKLSLIDLLIESENQHASGAGILPYCITTQRFLLCLRSDIVLHPMTWSSWGGKTEEGESASETAIREFKEETNYSGSTKLIKAYVYDKEDENFFYTNFIGIIQKEFIPKLNLENEDFKWVTYKELLRIEPKHYGFKLFIDHSKQLLENLMISK